MPVAHKMKAYAANSSFIRKMFEQGAALKAEHGADNVYDFSIGNPDLNPPQAVLDSLSRNALSMSHGYMPNAGYPDVRSTVAAFAGQLYDVKLEMNDIIMTCGAGGALNVVLKAILNPGDEVIAIAPYFVEYRFYVENHGGELVVAQSDSNFLPDIESIKAAISDKTKAIIVNSPNNPTGRVYPAATLDALNDLLSDHPDVVVISDEPYRRLVYDGIEVPSVLKHIANSIVVTSASKELSLPGQRIGYIAVGSGVSEKADLLGAMVLANRILGFVNAPALMQKTFAECINLSVDMEIYARRRQAFIEILEQAGLSFVPPEGTFYLFVKAPIEDDVAFCAELVKERILAVPGTGFGYPGYVRFAYCVDEKFIRAAGPGLKRVVESLQ